MITKQTIDNLKAMADIVDVVNHYHPLKKQGLNYSACCPFHDEKTPSFTVSPKKQFYHCFGCGAHGDVISFVMEHQGLSFSQATDELCKQYNIGIEVDDSKKIMPRSVKDEYEMDKIILLMAEEHKNKGMRVSYLDKKRIQLAARRISVVENKYK